MKLNLDYLLEKQNKSIYWLKKETGISHATMYKMVNNKTSMITFSNLEKLCIALKCSPNDIFEYALSYRTFRAH